MEESHTLPPPQHSHKVHLDVIVQNDDKLVQVKASDYPKAVPWFSEIFSKSCSSCKCDLKIEVLVHKCLEVYGDKLLRSNKRLNSQSVERSVAQSVSQPVPKTRSALETELRDLEDNNDHNNVVQPPMVSIPNGNIEHNEHLQNLKYEPDSDSDQSQEPMDTDEDADTVILPYTTPPYITRSTKRQMQNCTDGDPIQDHITPIRENINNNDDNNNNSDSDKGLSQESFTSSQESATLTVEHSLYVPSEISSCDEKDNEENEPKKKQTRRRRRSSAKKNKEPSNKVYPCSVCYEIFSSAASRSEHRRNHSLKCRFCDRSFGKLSSLYTHCYIYHKKERLSMKSNLRNALAMTPPVSQPKPKITNPLPGPSGEPKGQQQVISKQTSFLNQLGLSKEAQNETQLDPGSTVDEVNHDRPNQASDKGMSNTPNDDTNQETVGRENDETITEDQNDESLPASRPENDSSLMNNSVSISAIERTPDKSQSDANVFKTPQRKRRATTHDRMSPLSQTIQSPIGNNIDGFVCEKCNETFKPKKVFNWHQQHAQCGSPKSIKAFFRNVTQTRQRRNLDRRYFSTFE